MEGRQDEAIRCFDFDGLPSEPGVLRDRLLEAGVGLLLRQSTSSIGANQSTEAQE